MRRAALAVVLLLYLMRVAVESGLEQILYWKHLWRVFQPVFGILRVSGE